MGISELAEVKEACLEANGELSVIKTDSATENSKPPKSKAKPA
ncbi:YetF domain-containing protein [Bradyrhizobium sp. AUGA SZCCT0160]